MTSIEDLAKQAEAAEDLIDAVGRILDTAARSAVIEVINATTCTLRLGRHVCEHGAFESGALPAPTILPMQSAVAGSRSAADAIMTGTEGRMWYGLEDLEGTFYIRWNVPFAGRNESNGEVRGGVAPMFEMLPTIAGGTKKVRARFILAERTLTGPSDSNWITCGECKALVYRLDPGKCPGRVDIGGRVPASTSSEGFPWPGGEPRNLPHQPAGWQLKLYHSVPGPFREGGWRKCRRCKQLFWDGEESKGKCPKWSNQPGHVAEEGSPEYFLQHDVPPRAGQQNDWRFCTKCFGLFFLPHNPDGDCAAGGRHHAHPYNYVLDIVQ